MALNAMTLAMAIELESTGIKVNAASPGFTKTNLNNYAGTQTVEEGAREPVRLALLGPDGPTGTFSNADGPLPWRSSGTSCRSLRPGNCAVRDFTYGKRTA
jgi:NAD(P)-dependent dehydrogenase (short-subunit alcohol dehydrogenase family)